MRLSDDRVEYKFLRGVAIGVSKMAQEMLVRRYSIKVAKAHQNAVTLKEKLDE